MEEWSFKDEATAEAFLKSKQKQLRHRAASRRKSLLQVCVHEGCACMLLIPHRAGHACSWHITQIMAHRRIPTCGWHA